ncbi:hypothetical protein J1614_009479 [Plenodomus biglobosus]|nr:hypothetical protein J1614_009479 [Plenodomus biglobosus]
MLQFSSLRYYSLPALQSDHVIPRSLTVELGIFAGRLYMQYEECAPLLEYINKASMNRRSDARKNDKISFILEWVSLRRRGHDIMHTPLGYVCQGRLLGMEHAFFVTNCANDNGVVNSYHANGSLTSAQVDEDKDEDEKYYDRGESLSRGI